MDMNEYLTYIIENLRFATCTEADRFLKMHYETVFRIHDHKADFERTKRPPLATSRHSGMGAGSYEVVENTLKAYVDHHIKKITDMSFLEYSMIPKPMVAALNRKCVELNNAIVKDEEERKKKEEEYMQNLFNQGKSGLNRGNNNGAMPPM